MHKSYFIGIAGGSCSGKTSICRRLADRLQNEKAIEVSIDAYYKNVPEDALGDIDRYNFDEPHALEEQLLIKQLGDLSDGRDIQKPVYDFKTHTRSTRTEHIRPKPFIILEGMYALYWSEIRDLLQTRVFIDASHDVCLDRRVFRDQKDRGRTIDEVTRRYHRMVRPMYDAYVLPTREFADVIVDGRQPLEGSVEAILNHIVTRTGSDT